MIEIIFTVVLVAYLIQLLMYGVGAHEKFLQVDGNLPTATVIVAARNEENNILRTLESLDSLDYPENKLEIVIVDGHSTDSTYNLVKEFIRDKPKFSLFQSQEETGNLRGKANAIDTAIKNSKGEIILTTDADCYVKPQWVKATASYYKDGVGAVNGFTTQEATDGFSGMQAVDFIYLLTIASGTMNINMPTSCIGNNMSYRRSAYEETGGYRALPFSVTEDFNLLMAFTKLKKYKLIFPLNLSTLVTSLPCSSRSELYHQKKRWGVGGMEAPFHGFLLMGAGWLTSLFILLTPLFLSYFWITLIIIKILIEFILLYKMHAELKIKENMKYFFHFQLYFTIYVLILPFMVIDRKVKWKGKDY